jgi:hypothetical protein
VAYDTSSFFDDVEDAVEEFAAVMRGERKTYAQCSDKELADLIEDIGLSDKELADLIEDIGLEVDLGEDPPNGLGPLA